MSCVRVRGRKTSMPPAAVLASWVMDVAMSRENVHSRCEVRTGFEQTSHAVPVRTGISYSQGQGARNHCECCQNHTVDEIGERTVWCATSRSRVSTVTVGLLDLGCQVAKVHSYWMTFHKTLRVCGRRRFVAELDRARQS